MRAEGKIVAGDPSRNLSTGNLKNKKYFPTYANEEPGRLE